MLKIVNETLIDFKEEPDMTEVVVPGSVKIIEEYVFFATIGIKKIIISEGVEEINDFAFAESYSLEEIYLPKSLKKIGAGAFWGSSHLKCVHTPNGLPQASWNLFKFCSSLKNAVIADSAEIIAEGAFFGCSSLKEITLPSKLKQIDPSAFFQCSSLEKIVIPNGVENIESQAFSMCSGLRSVTLPPTVKHINYAAFEGCQMLENIILPENLISLGHGAFRRCINLKSIFLPKTLQHIKMSPFLRCSLIKAIDVSPENEHFTTENGVLFNADKTEIIEYPCGKKGRYTVPDTVTKIANGAMAHCEYLKELTIDGVTIDISDISTVFDEPNIILTLIRTQDFSTRMNSVLKEKVAVAMYLQKNSTDAFTYIKKHLPNIMLYLTTANDCNTIKQLAERGNLITKRNIMKYIDMAIEHTRVSGDPQIQILLTNYKNEHFPDTTSLGSLGI